MRHSNSGRKLSRTPAHRKALLQNLAKALLIHGKIRTTEIKAKELRRVVEPLITLAKRNDLHARRQAYRVLNDHALVKRLFDEIGPVFAGVPGGYTRILKLAMPRKGDNAPMPRVLDKSHTDNPCGQGELRPMNPALNPDFGILIVDDEPAWLRALSLTLESSAGITNVFLCEDSRKALPLLSKGNIGLVILDLTMSAMPGKVKTEYNIDIPSPREYTHPSFLALRKQISEDTDLVL